MSSNQKNKGNRGVLANHFYFPLTFKPQRASHITAGALASRRTSTAHQPEHSTVPDGQEVLAVPGARLDQGYLVCQGALEDLGAQMDHPDLVDLQGRLVQDFPVVHVDLADQLDR